MARILCLLLCGVAAVVVSINAGAAEKDDGFVWVDANTKIRVTPIGKAAAGGTAPEKAPKEKKKEKPPK